MLKTMITATIMTMSALFASDKFYLEPEQVALTEEAIYVQLGEELVEIDRLLVDQGGIYIIEDDMRCSQCRRSAFIDTPCHKRLNPKNTCHKRLNPKNTCHKRLNPKNTCDIT